MVQSKKLTFVRGATPQVLRNVLFLLLLVAQGATSERDNGDGRALESYCSFPPPDDLLTSFFEIDYIATFDESDSNNVILNETNVALQELIPTYNQLAGNREVYTNKFDLRLRFVQLQPSSFDFDGSSVDDSSILIRGRRQRKLQGGRRRFPTISVGGGECNGCRNQDNEGVQISFTRRDDSSDDSDDRRQLISEPNGFSPDDDDDDALPDLPSEDEFLTAYASRIRSMGLENIVDVEFLNEFTYGGPDDPNGGGGGGRRRSSKSSTSDDDDDETCDETSEGKGKGKKGKSCRSKKSKSKNTRGPKLKKGTSKSSKGGKDGVMG